MQTTRPTSQASSLPTTSRIEAVALYGAFALISAIVFGTLSFHPF